MLSPVDRLADSRVPASLVFEYCEACGQEVTGERRCDDLPEGYRYNVFRLYAGTCPKCRRRTTPVEPQEHVAAY